MSYAGRVAIQLIDRSDAELIVIKPAGLACEHPRDERADSLVRQLAQQGLTGLRLVHRLDAPACGLMVIARTAAAAAHYSTEIAARRWHKFYVARLAVTTPVAHRLIGSHKAYLKTDGAIARIVRAGGKPSFLDVIDAAPVPGDANATDVLIRLHTGRFHQIRAMLAHLGAPLAGDGRYGGPTTSPLYLEHVMLGARPVAAAWRLWTAPAHADRPRWHDTLAAAVDAQAGLVTAEMATAGEPGADRPSDDASAQTE